MAPFESLGTVSYSFSIVTMALTWHHFGDKARYWSKIAISAYPLHSTPPAVRGSPLEYYHNVWYGKTRMVGIFDGKKLRICSAMLTGV